MPNYTRYAVYYVPPEGSDLARFGAAWLGWDSASGQTQEHPTVGDLDVAAITATPRKYGFHGTLKPPFRLDEGTNYEDLANAVAALAVDVAPFNIPPLVLKSLGFFLALVPSAPCPALGDLASRCVQDLDAFRAPPSEAELARRRAAGLTNRQDTYLTQWGYPYILEEFRFHLTLSGRLEPRDLSHVFEALGPLTQPLRQDPMPIRELGLLGEVDGGRFQLIHRYPLTG